jgi:hypothetical protein
VRFWFSRHGDELTAFHFVLLLGAVKDTASRNIPSPAAPRGRLRTLAVPCWRANYWIRPLKSYRVSDAIQCVPSFSSNTFAGYTHRDASDGRKFSCRLASVFVWAVPFTTAQERTDKLPLALVAMDAIAAMESHHEWAIPPAFVNVVGDGPRHTRGTC